MPARGLSGEKVQVNLQTGAYKCAGARNVHHQPGANRFDTSFLNRKVERNPRHYLLKSSFDGHICGHTHRLVRATSEKTACDIRAGIKLHLSCTVGSAVRLGLHRSYVHIATITRGVLHNVYS